MAAAAGGQRTTRQRAAVRTLLAGTAEFRSAQELHAALKGAGAAVGLTTVYRTLAALADTGEVDTIQREDGETLYRRCEGEHHHHHLVCRDCGRTVEVDGPAVERWASRVATEHGFTDLSHTVEIFGRCRACTRSARRRP